MTDERHKRVPNPHLRTRPATMLTAIGLCMIIIMIQLVPEIQDMSARFTTASTSTSITR